jgi:hypothetical protein
MPADNKGFIIMMRNHIRKICGVLLLLCVITGVSRAETVISDATYKGKFTGLTVETERRLVELDDGSYRLSSKASNFLGSLKETSHFLKLEDQWRPLKYTYKRRIFGTEALETIDFDWDAMTAYYTHSEKPERDAQHRLTAGVLDPALYLLRMQRDLVRGNEILDYRFVKRDRIRHYRIARLQTEDLDFGDKSYRVIKMGRTNADDEKQTHVWVIPALSYLFGKIVHLEDGDAHQMTLTRYSVNKPLLQRFFAAEPQASSTEKIRPN